MKSLYLLFQFPLALATALSRRLDTAVSTIPHLLHRHTPNLNHHSHLHQQESIIVPRGAVSCGSRGQPPCATGYYCIPDPNYPSCSFAADCPGYCVILDGPQCAGFTGARCPDSGEVCVDDPRDDCDPRYGGADCAGICVYLDGRSACNCS